MDNNGTEQNGKTEKSGNSGWIVVIAVLLIAAATAALFFVVQQQTREDGFPFLIGLSQPGLSGNAQLALYNEIDACCEAEDIRLIAYDAGESTAKQRTDIRALTELGVDALIISSDNAEAMTDAIADAYNKGIVVILIGSVPVGGVYTCNIMADNYHAGLLAGEFTASLFEDQPCTVLEIQGEARSRISKDLQRGYLEVIDGYPDITKEYVMTGYWTQVDTQERITESAFFSRKPPIDVIFAHNDSMAIAAAITSEERGKDPVIISVGGYALPNSDLEAVRDGRLDAAVHIPTGGREAVETAVRIIREKETPPGSVRLDTELVTAENVEEYLAAAEKTAEDPAAAENAKETPAAEEEVE